MAKLIRFKDFSAAYDTNAWPKNDFGLVNWIDIRNTLFNEEIDAIPTGYPVGGWHAVDHQGNIMKKPNAKYGDLAPRFKSYEKAIEWGKKQQKRLLKIKEYFSSEDGKTILPTGKKPKKSKDTTPEGPYNRNNLGGEIISLNGGTQE